MNDSRPDTFIVVGFLILVQGTGAVAGFWLPAIAPEVADNVGLNASLIAYPVLLLYIFAMISSLFAGGFVNRFGAWRTSQLALLLIGISHLMFMGGSLFLIALGSVVLGWAYGMITPPASHLLSKVVTKKNRNLIFSIRFTGVPIGGVLAGILAPQVALEFGWQQSMLFSVIVAAGLCLAMQPFRCKWDSDRSSDTALLRNPLTDLQLVWRLTSLRWVALYGMCMGAIQTTLTTFTVTMLVEDIGYSLVLAGLGLSVIQFSSIFGRVAWGWVADKINNGLLTLMIIALIAMICAVITITLSPQWPHLLVYTLCFVFGVAGMGWNGVYASEIVRLSPKNDVSKTTGASFFITFSGVFVGPLLFSTGYSIVGAYNISFFLTIIIALSATFFILKSQAAASGAPE